MSSFVDNNKSEVAIVLGEASDSAVGIDPVLQRGVVEAGLSGPWHLTNPVQDERRGDNDVELSIVEEDRERKLQANKKKNETLRGEVTE